MTTEEMVCVANSVAKRYRKKCWWASVEDMRQEALVTMLRAHQTYLQNPEGDERGYLWKSAVYAVKHLLLRASAPVSATSHTLDELKGLTRAPLDSVQWKQDYIVKTEQGREMKVTRPAAVVAEDGVDSVLEDLGWLKRVRSRVSAVLCDVPNSVLAREVLLGYLTPAETAEEAGVPVRTVYRAVKAAKKVISGDRALYDLTQERVK